jgi:hypothetical protein
VPKHKLDLHGVKHQDVELEVENFVFMNQYHFPLTIICGNSASMVSIVKTMLDRIGCNYTMLRYGVITVMDFS